MDDARQNLVLHGLRLGQNRVQRSDDWHGESPEQPQDMLARLPAKNAVLMLKADEVELLRIQEVGSVYVFLEISVVDLQADRRRIFVTMPMIGHCDDGSVHTRARLGKGLLQIRRECGDAAAARQRIAYECQTATRSQLDLP